MSLDKTQLIFFAGKKMNVEEFIEAYQLEEESDQSIQIIMDRLAKKGRIRYLDQADLSMKAFEEVARDLELEDRIAQMEADAEEADAYAMKKKREGKLTYDEVEIDFPTKSLAMDFRDYASSKLRLDAAVQAVDNGVYVLVLKKVTDTDLNNIKRRKNFAQAGKMVFDTTDKLSNTVIGAADFATGKVVLPTAKAALKTSFGLARGLVRTGAQVGSSVITNTSENSRTMRNELSNDEDVLKAKKELVDAKDAIKRLFNRRGTSSPDIRIK